MRIKEWTTSGRKSKASSRNCEPKSPSGKTGRMTPRSEPGDPPLPGWIREISPHGPVDTLAQIRVPADLHPPLQASLI